MSGLETVGEALTRVATALAAAGFAAARREARVLLGIAVDAEPLALLTQPERQLDHGQAKALEAILQRRLAGEPASRIRGQREFWSLNFTVGPGVLDPRPETELMVERALAHVGCRRMEPLRILDLGTGTGCILLSLLHELPRAFGVGLDSSSEALAVARENGSRLGFAGRAAWVCGRWLAPIGGGFDLIVANPPYIPAGQVATLDRSVRQFDPRDALDGGPDGLASYRQIIPQLQGILRLSGGALLEVGTGQAGMVASMGRNHGLAAQITGDLGGIPRCVGLFTKF